MPTLDSRQPLSITQLRKLLHSVVNVCFSACESHLIKASFSVAFFHFSGPVRWQGIVLSEWIIAFCNIRKQLRNRYCDSWEPSMYIKVMVQHHVGAPSCRRVWDVPDRWSPTYNWSVWIMCSTPGVPWWYPILYLDKDWPSVEYQHMPSNHIVFRWEPLQAIS